MAHSRDLLVDCATPSDPTGFAVVVVGEGEVLGAHADAADHQGIRLLPCDAQMRHLERTLAEHSPDWLLFPPGQDIQTCESLLRAARAIMPGLLVAVLGLQEDLARLRRWRRLHFTAYLSVSTPIQRLLSLLRLARDHRVVIVDRCFQESARLQQIQPVTELTRREREVLDQIRLGRRSQEISHHLHIAPSTVEFHVRNLLEKLGARNRVEAVQRASRMAL